jgi:hypothetical protein
VRERGDLHAAERRQDVDGDLVPVVALRGGALARHVIGQETFTEVGDRLCTTGDLNVTQRIGTAVDCPLQPLGFVASCPDAPGGRIPDGEDSLLSIGAAAVAQHEGASIGGRDPHTKPRNRIVIGDAIATLGRRQPLHDRIGEPHLLISRVLTVSSARRGDSVRRCQQMSDGVSEFLRCCRGFRGSEKESVFSQGLREGRGFRL